MAHSERDQIGQNGIPIPGKVQVFVGSQWLHVTPFALTLSPPSPLYLDPGPPPQLGGVSDALFKERIVNMLSLAAQLTPDDGVPAAMQAKLCRLLARAAGAEGMAGGQAIDLASVGKSLTEDQLRRMHRL